MIPRGSYRKGVAKREEILATALEVIARSGYDHTSVRELAQAVGLSQAGLLHYFSSKDELFAEIIRKRDETDYDAFMTSQPADGRDVIRALGAAVRHNAQVPGLVQLYVRLSAEATEKDHVAHDYFVTRYDDLREELADGIRLLQSTGAAPARLDAHKLATIFVALADGLQTQWMLDPSVDMSEHFEYLWGIILGAN